MNSALRILIAGGGTGGHVFPALALAEELRRLCPEVSLLFVGSSGGLEQTLVPAHGHELALLQVGKLKGSALSVRIRTLAGLGPAVAGALSILRRFRPGVVVGVGGFASGPVVMAATLLGLPIVLLEQNSVPGITNRVLSRLARRVVVAFAHAERYLPAGRAVLLGNPVRPRLADALLAQPLPAEKARLGEPPCLLVLGGSQGAHAINEYMVCAAPILIKLIPSLRIIHQSGNADAPSLSQRYQAAGIEAQVHPFIDDMASAFRPAWLVLGRSGATTLAELTLAGLPALLVPYPFAADDHQTHNAAELERAGAAIRIPQDQLDANRLADRLGGLLGDLPRLQAMAEAMRRCARPEAGARAAQLVASLADAG